MTTELITVDKSALLVRDWLRTKSERTRRAYGQDIQRYVAWAGPDAIQSLLSAGRHSARRLALDYREALIARKLAPATINRALSALKSLVALADELEFIDWRLHIDALKSESYRDTRGPDRDTVLAIVAAAAAQKDQAKACRDNTLIRLIYGLALRRSEAVSLDVAHFVENKLWILGKGKTERVGCTVPPVLIDALRAWLDFHPQPTPGAPLFTALSNATRGVVRLSAEGVRFLLAEICRAAGTRVISPHALRHAAVTAALDRSAHNVRAVQRFSRHARLETVQVYDDALHDLAGEIAALVAI